MFLGEVHIAIKYWITDVMAVKAPSCAKLEPGSQGESPGGQPAWRRRHRQKKQIDFSHQHITNRRSPGPYVFQVPDMCHLTAHKRFVIVVVCLFSSIVMGHSHSCSEVLRSDRFHYDGKLNRTLECIQQHIVESLNHCSNGDDPALQGWTMHLTVSKGDWKHKKEWLAADRHYSNVSGQGGSNGPGKGRICPRCLAGDIGRGWADCREPWENEADLATAARTSSSGLYNIAVFGLLHRYMRTYIHAYIHI